MNHTVLTIDDEQVQNIRVDSYIADHAGVLPRSQMKKRKITLLVNDKPAKFSKKVSAGDVVDLSWGPAPDLLLEPEDIPLDILYEDDACIVVNKPRGMVVHPAAGNFTGTLVHALLYHCKELVADGAADLRPGIVHRLDKETSGVIIAAKNPVAQEFLSRQFRKRHVAKKYYAVVKGSLHPTSGEVDRNIQRDPRHRKRFTTTDEGGKTARTAFRVLSRTGGCSVVALRPRTGRTHQLRVHMLSLGVPILGDPLYARHNTAFPDAPLMLHAYSLTIRLPGEADTRTFRAPLPADFKAVLRAMAGTRKGAD